VFQAVADAGVAPNAGAGVCLYLTPDAGQTLSAVGNRFGATNCVGDAGATLVSSAICAGASDYGIEGAGTTNKIDLRTCGVP
jgi:hypothetical protein